MSFAIAYIFRTLSIPYPGGFDKFFSYCHAEKRAYRPEKRSILDDYIVDLTKKKEYTSKRF